MSIPQDPPYPMPPPPFPLPDPDAPDPDEDEPPPAPRPSLLIPRNLGSVNNCGARDQQVRVPFRDPVTGKACNHYKAIRGPKKAAQAYLEWYAGLLAAGEAPETVSQAELQDLAALELKAAKLREKLLARVDSGARVEPGPLSLSVNTAVL